MSATETFVCPDAVNHGNPFRYCPVEGCGWREDPPARSGAELIAIERTRQVHGEGWDAEHDQEHTAMELTTAASIAYATMASGQVNIGCADGDPFNDMPFGWPWDLRWWKPSPDPVRNLVKAGALLAAEIDRLVGP